MSNLIDDYYRDLHLDLTQIIRFEQFDKTIYRAV